MAFTLIMHRFLIATAAALLGACSFAQAQNTQTDIEFARVDGLPLMLDLHKPAALNPPLIVYVHGGAWRAGDKKDVPIFRLVNHGYAIASIGYRLSTQAVFPAQIHDIKAAIRYLRAKATLYQIDASRVAVVGSSAGGHLAALVGVSNGQTELEGKVGDCLDQSSDVQCTVSFYGASNLQTLLSQSSEEALKMRVPALQLLLGGQPVDKPALAKLASPVAHLDNNDPPLLLIHGDADPQMPYAQSQELERACQAKDVSVRLDTMPGSMHGGAEFYDEERIAIVARFLDQHLHKP